jgi:hypothetical protein
MIMATKEKEVKSTNGISKLIAEYNKIKDLNSPEARKIRKQLRDMGTSIRECLKKDKPEVAKKEAKKVVKAAEEIIKSSGKKKAVGPAVKASKKTVVADDDDEGEE